MHKFVELADSPIQQIARAAHNTHGNSRSFTRLSSKQLGMPILLLGACCLFASLNQKTYIQLVNSKVNT
jgi:hypothetical protein